jgi:hypothetical protein
LLLLASVDPVLLALSQVLPIGAFGAGKGAPQFGHDTSFVGHGALQ